jgi:putative hydrolase of the HAD superfamily
MYLTALEQLGVQPASSLFVGDGGSNELAGAKEVGMRSLLLDDQPVDQTKVLRVDVHEWDGPSVRSIADVVKVATSLRDDESRRRII